MDDRADNRTEEQSEHRTSEAVMEEDAAEQADIVTEEPESRELEQIKNELKETHERLLRQAAEYQNFRRRSEEEIASAAKYGRAQVLLEMLDVYDDLERSLQAAGKAEETGVEAAFEALKSGLELVRKKFEERLRKFGVERIEAVGQPFHEDVHEALMQQPAPEGTDEGTVISEVQKGYKLGDRVLRHAKVVVAK